MERLALLAVTAHPGDELVVAGTLAHHAQAGVHVALVCATSATGDGTQAEHDLRCAGSRLGVAEIHFLGYRPQQPTTGYASGQESLIHASACEVIRRIVRLIRAIRPQVMVTFGPEGIDGHPDHVAIGELATQACGAAGDRQQFPLEAGAELYAPAKLYYFGLPEGVLRLAGVPGRGTQDEAVPAQADVSQFIDRKVEAARCYRAGVEPPLDQLFALPPAERQHLLAVEYLTLAQPQPGAEDRRDPHLFAGIP